MKQPITTLFLLLVNVCISFQPRPLFHKQNYSYNDVRSSIANYNSASSKYKRQRFYYQSSTSNDEELLASVTLEQLQDLADQQNLSTKGNKLEILQRLRQFAEMQAKEQESEDGVYYYSSPEPPLPKKAELSTKETNDNPFIPITTSESYVNEKGERVVTVFSTEEEIDLTTFGAHSMPGGMDTSAASFANAVSSQNSQDGATSSGFSALDTLSGRTRGGGEGSNNGEKIDESELNDVKETIRELVEYLLEGTAPGFCQELSAQSRTSDYYKTFDPNTVSVDMLNKYSRVIRFGKGRAFREVIREVELEAVGQDGFNGDDVEKGGGHYKEVQKVSAFLNGFRTAESRRVSRETVTFLLNTVINDGTKGLEFTFATMARGDNDESPLNDDLLEYLDDAVDAQEKVVETAKAQQNASSKRRSEPEEVQDDHDENYSTYGEDKDSDHIYETIDLNDEDIRAKLMKELTTEKPDEESNSFDAIRSRMNAGEQVLWLLKLLRDRVKVEAVFKADEHGQNLRLLANALNAPNSIDRKNIIETEIGSSFNRSESFSELIDNAVAYTKEIKKVMNVLPSSSKLPDLEKLIAITKEVAEIRAQQASNASGIKESKRCDDDTSLSPWQ